MQGSCPAEVPVASCTWCDPFGKCKGPVPTCRISSTAMYIPEYKVLGKVIDPQPSEVDLTLDAGFHKPNEMLR